MLVACDPLRAVWFSCALIFFVLSSWSPEAARAQQAAPLLKGPSESRPELELRDESDDSAASRRILPRIEIPVEESDTAVLSGGTIPVRSFRFTGNTSLSDEELEAVTRSYLGEARRYSALLEARDRVTRAYIDAGYISSGAVLPRQAFQNGVVEIEIVEGQLTRVEIDNDGRLRDHYFESRIRAQGGTLNVNDMRERLRRLKRDPRIDAVAAELTPGEERGSSILSIAVDEAIPYWGTASFDNYTAESVGGLRGRFRAGHRNLTGSGESLSLAYAVAEGLHDLDIRVEAPVNRLDTSVEIWMRRAWSEIIEDDLEALDIESKTQAYGFRVKHPILRQRGQEARLLFSADWKRGQAFLLGDKGIVPGDPNNGESTVAVLRFGADYILRLKERAIAARVTANIGLDILDATDSSDDEFPDGQFVSGLFQLQEVEYLPWYDMRVQTRIDAQLANDHLLGLEQFAIGGHASVRGFRENLIVRDEGVVGSVELRIPLPLIDPVERFELGIFTDVGHGNDVGNNRPPSTVVGLGLGLHADITQYVRTSLQWAIDLQKDRDAKDASGSELQDDGVHFALQLRFP